MSTRTSTLADWARFPENAVARPAHQGEQVGRALRSFGAEPWIGGLCALAVYAILGVWMALRYGVMGDAFARLANAYYVLFSRDPHLAALGFIWNPLPSLLELPLVALKGLWPPLVRQGVAADLVTAVFGGLAVFYMLRLLRRFGVPGGLRCTVTLIFALNPGIAFYAANGMTDLMMAAAMLGALDGLWAYLEERHVPALLASGLWMAIAFLIRYDVVAWALAVALAVAYGLARPQREREAAAEAATWIKGVVLLWVTPLVAATTTWLFVNWMIMGDALYFLGGAYSNAAQNATGVYAWAPLAAAAHSVAGTSLFLARQTLIFPPVVLGIIGLLAFGLRGRHEVQGRALVLVAATVGVALLQGWMLYRGESDGWLRYFFTFIPFGFLSLAYGARLMATRWPGLRWLAWGGCLLVLAGGSVVTYTVMLTPASPLRYEVPTQMREEDAVIAYLDAHPRLSVLTDSFLSFPIIVGVRRPAQLVISSDRDFATILRHPIGTVAAILVPEPHGLGQLDAVNRQYPRLWQGGVRWTHLAATFPLQYVSKDDYHWRLYMIAPAPGVVGKHVSAPEQTVEGVTIRLRSREQVRSALPGAALPGVVVVPS